MNDNAALDLQIFEQELEREIQQRGFRLFHELQTQSRKQWLVHNLLGHAEASVMYGKPGDGKSVLAEDLGLHVAAGMPWHGRAVKRGTVLYVALERRALVERRAIAFREKHKPGDLPFAIVGGVHDFRLRRTAQHFVDLVGTVEGMTGERTTLIQIDTLSRGLCGGDENSPKDMGAIVSQTGFLQEKTGAAVMWVHHVPIDGDRLRGHGALLGGSDTTIHVVKTAGTLRTATVIKANDSEEGECVAFTLESETIGTEADGTETTAPVVVPADGATAARIPQGTRGLTKAAHTALRALTEAIDEQGAPAPASNHIPASARTVTLDTWRQQAYRRGISAGEERAQQLAFRRAVVMSQWRRKDWSLG
jgi:RecA-family ATPase